MSTIDGTTTTEPTDPATETTTDRVKVTIVGAGVIGRHHGTVVDALADEIELLAVADTHPERAAALASAHGGTPYASLTEALAATAGTDGTHATDTPATDTHVVVICTPTGTHADLAIEALQAGRHVIVEKPADITPARVDDIIAARDASGRLVSVISQHRFDASTQVVLEKIAAGGFGRLVSGIASIDWWRSQEYYDSGDWRGTWALDGGGALMNQGVHTVDLLVAALGRPVEVFAYTSTLAHTGIEVEDVAVGVVTFESGALGLLHASTAAYPGLSARLQIHGDRGSAIIDNDTLTYLHVSPPPNAGEGEGGGVSSYGSNDITTGNQAGDYPDASTRPPVGAGADPSSLSLAHVAQYRNVLAALRGQERLVVGLEENRQSLAVICGVYESARTGKPVRL